MSKSKIEPKVHFQLGDHSACGKTHSTLLFVNYTNTVTCKLCQRWMKKHGLLIYPVSLTESLPRRLLNWLRWLIFG